MCEPEQLARTGKTIREHQELTVASLVELRRIAPDLPWVPVLQGQAVADYLRHIDMYRVAGFDLRYERIVGVGSVCRRQGTREAAEIMSAIAARGIRIHAFGVKRDGLALFGDRIASSDSMAWSFVARRRRIRLDGCTHANCANCFRFAMQWCSTLVSGLRSTAPQPQGRQAALPW